MLSQRKIVLEPAERGKDNNADRGDSEVAVGGRRTEILTPAEILDALIALVDPAKWQQYCSLLAEVRAEWPPPTPFAPGGPGLQYTDPADYGRARLLSLHGNPWHCGQVTMWDGEARRFAADRITEIQALDHTILAEIRAGLAAGCAQVTIWQGVDRIAVPAEWFRNAKARIYISDNRIIGPDGVGYAIAAIAPPARETQSEPSVGNAAAPTPSGIRTTSAAKAEDACRKWLAGLEERPKNKNTAFADAKAAIAGGGPLSRKAFDRAWALSLRPEWRTAGRRPKGRR